MQISTHEKVRFPYRKEENWQWKKEIKKKDKETCKKLQKPPNTREREKRLKFYHSSATKLEKYRVQEQQF